MVGKTLGKYRIVETLGRGGMGVVYKAVDETLDREVAIKIFSADLDEQDVVTRFRTEATTLAKLNHPEIATIYELYRWESDLLMVMEYVRGETLEKLSHRSGPLPPERAAYLAAQVLGALDYAHRSGIVHRDLKPANVMVNDQGHVKVMDFGIARVLGAAHTTMDGFMMGTPAYMAPEQVLGQEVDPRADLYSVGVVFYRLLTGTLPFRSDTVIGMVQKQVSDQPTPARVHRADIPDWCEAVLTRALAKLPAERFQAAEEFRQALLEPLNSAVMERTLPLGGGPTPRPAPTRQVAAVAPPIPSPTVAVAAPSVAPPPTVAAPPARTLMPSGALSVAGVAAVLKANPLASGGAVLALIAVALLAVLALRQVTPAPVDAPPASAGVVVLPTSPGTQAAASTPVSVPTGKPAGGAYELKRPEVAAQPGRPLERRRWPRATWRRRVPRLPERLPDDRRQRRALRPLPSRPRRSSKKTKRRKSTIAKVLLSEGIVTVTVRLDRSSEAVLSTIPFGSVRLGQLLEVEAAAVDHAFGAKAGLPPGRRAGVLQRRSTLAVAADE